MNCNNMTLLVDFGTNNIYTPLLYSHEWNDIFQ